MRRTPWFRSSMYVLHALTRTEFQEHAIVEPHARHPVGEVPWTTSGMDLLRRSYLLACGYNKPRFIAATTEYIVTVEPADEISLLIATRDHKQLSQRWEATYGEYFDTVLASELWDAAKTIIISRMKIRNSKWKFARTIVPPINSILKSHFKRWRYYRVLSRLLFLACEFCYMQTK